MNIKIEYDKEINQVFISGENKSIQINRTEVATVEKILEALEIPYTEKLGEVFLFDTVKKPSVEYTTEELIDLGKKLNVLNLAPPLYSNKDDKDDSDKIDSKNTK